MQVLVATPSTPPPKALHVVIGELQNVVARMRLNSRWASSASRLMSYSEGPLLQGFKALRNTLSQVEDLTEMDPLTYLKPFLGVIRSEETSGPITGVALSSINKFLNYGFIHEKTPNAAKAVATITEIVSNCRFEATQTESDEVVLATILEVLLSCLRCPAGFLLTDELVFSMVQFTS
ncbi:G-box binding factor [Balamuthia mandrillaris]